MSSSFRPYPICKDCEGNHCKSCWISAAEAAEHTLERLGYTYCGGELWKPPLGQMPDFALTERYRAEADLYRAWLMKLTEPEEFQEMERIMGEKFPIPRKQERVNHGRAAD